MRQAITAAGTVTTWRRERGAVLIVALLFLVILTILGLTAMSGTTMEERMAGNTRDINVALQAAEAALRDARRDINRRPLVGAGRDMPRDMFGDPGGAVGTCNATGEGLGLCRPFPLPVADYPAMSASINADNPAAVPYGRFTGALPLRATVEGVRNQPLAAQPRYLIERFCLRMPGVDSVGDDNAACNVYRITARGFGVNPNSQVTLQEVFQGDN
jgi:type IV pilus assembly protein PilX